MRLFVAIPLDAQVRSELEAVVARLKPKIAGLRWSSPESWHITLQFLGNTAHDQLPQLTAQLATVQSAPVPIQLGQLDTFDRAGVLVVCVQISDQLLALQRKVVAATGRCGFIPESRLYHPHITLGRAKPGGGRHALKDLRSRFPEPSRFSAFAAREFLLFESFLESGGARYEIREHFSLT